MTSFVTELKFVSAAEVPKNRVNTFLFWTKFVDKLGTSAPVFLNAPACSDTATLHKDLKREVNKEVHGPLLRIGRSVMENVADGFARPGTMQKEGKLKLQMPATIRWGSGLSMKESRNFGRGVVDSNPPQ